VRTNNGQRLMDTIRGVIATMNGEENRLLAGRTALARDGVRPVLPTFWRAPTRSARA